MQTRQGRMRGTTNKLMHQVQVCGAIACSRVGIGRRRMGIDMNNAATLLSFARGLATWLSDWCVDIDSPKTHSRKLQHGTTGDQNACGFGQVVVVIEAQEGFMLMAAVVEDSGS